MSMVRIVGIPSATAARRAAVVAPVRSASAQQTSIWSASACPRRWWLAWRRTAQGAVWVTAMATSSGATMMKGPGQERRRTSVSAQAQVWQEIGATSSTGRGPGFGSVVPGTVVRRQGGASAAVWGPGSCPRGPSHPPPVGPAPPGKWGSRGSHAGGQLPGKRGADSAGARTAPAIGRCHLPSARGRWGRGPRC